MLCFLLFYFSSISDSNDTLIKRQLLLLQQLHVQTALFVPIDVAQNLFILTAPRLLCAVVASAEFEYEDVCVLCAILHTFPSDVICLQECEVTANSRS